MKGCKTLVVLVGLAVTAFATSDALAYYHPRVARFCQRDPIGYEDGMSLYEYVRSNPTGSTDPMGLWKIDRQREARATATAQKGDTLTDLATAVRLDGFEMPRWAKGDIELVSDYGWWVWVHNLRVPLSKKFLDSEVCPGQKLTVPNTAYIDASSYSWGLLGWFLTGYKDGLSNMWSREGLKVIYTNTWNTSKQSILSHLQSDDIYKFGYIGHGAAGCMTGLSDSHVYNKGEYWCGSKGILSADKYTKYGIAELHVIACESYDSKWSWGKNISSAGKMRLVKGIMRVWNMADRLVYVTKAQSSK